MFRSIKASPFALSLIAGLTFAPAAFADKEFPTMGSAVGERGVTFVGFTLDGLFVQKWEAVGTDESEDPLIGVHLASGVTFIDLEAGTANSVFVAVSTENPGTSVFGTFSGTIGSDEDGNAVLDGTVTWLAGTGLLEGVSGSATATVIQEPEFDEEGKASHSYEWEGVFRFAKLPFPKK